MGHVAIWESVEVHTGFWLGNLKERDNMEQTILKWIFKQWDGGMEWIDLAQDEDRWWVLVSGVMNLWIS